MSFFQEMADLVIELMDVNDPDGFGESVVFTRPAGTYNATTRKKTATSPLTQTLAGTLNTKLSTVAVPDSLIAKFDGVIVAAPASSGGFRPGANDLAVISGLTYKVMETAHVVKRGIPIAWVCGVKTT